MNTHPDTGVAYGLVSSNDLDPELVDTLMHGPQAKDVSFEESWSEHLARELRARDLESEDDIDPATLSGLENDFADQYQPPAEIEITGTHEGVTYATCWLGGALSFWILESPHIGEGSRPSPCVPGACILHHPDTSSEWIGSSEGYTVPADWWAAREVEA